MMNTLPSKAKKIKDALQKTHAKAISLRGWAKLATLAGILSLFWILLVSIEQFAFLPFYLKIVGLLLCAFSVFLTYKYVRIDHIKSFNSFRERFAQDTNQWVILDYLDLYFKSDKSAADHIAIQKLDNSIDENVTVELLRKWHDELESTAKCRQRITWSSAILLISLSLSLSYLSSGSVRISQFWLDSVRPNPYQFETIPKQEFIEEGQSATFGLYFKDQNIPFTKELWLKNPGQPNFRPYPLTEDTSGRFLSSSFQIFGTTEYYFSMDGFTSDTLKLHSLKKPKLKQLQLIVKAPDYLKQPIDTFLYPFERIRFPEYSSVQLIGNPNKETNKLSIQWNGQKWAQLDKLGEHFSISFPDSLLQSTSVDTVDFNLNSVNGLVSEKLYSFLLQSVPDDVPTVQWVEPYNQSDIPENSALEIVYYAVDDYQIRSVWMTYELRSSFGKLKKNGRIALEKPDFNGLGNMSLNFIKELSLAPKDELSLVLHAVDHDKMASYKAAIPDTIRLLMPSLLSELDDLMEEESLFNENMDEVERLQEESESLSEQMKEGLRENPEQAWQQQRNLQQQIENQEQLEQKIEDLNKQFEELKEEMKDTDLLSPETLQAYDEYKKLLNELQDDDLKKALEEMQKALESMNPNQFRQSLENLEFNEEVYKQRLERTVELFKQLKTEANLERMKQSLEKMAAQQDSLAQSEDQNVAAQQDLREALDKLQKSMDQLDQDAPKKSKEDLQQLKEELSEQNNELKNDMDKLLDQMQQEENASSPSQQQQQQQQQQQDMAEKMKQMSKMLESQQSMMNQKQLNINIAALKSILGSIVVSSEFQEEINLRTSQMVSRSQGFVDQARQQQALNGFYQSISDSLLMVASEVTELSNEVLKLKERTKRTMERTLEQQSERSQNSAVVLERESLAGINELGQLVADVLEQLQNQMNNQGNGGSGMSSQQAMEQLKQMNGQQQQLNNQIQQMLNDMAGERLSMEQQQRLEQISKQQNQIRKQLEELQKSGAIPPGDRLQSELSRLQEEMEDSIRDLRGGNLDELFTKRQQNILSRMLEAEKSLQEKGEEEKREGETALEQLRNKSPELTLEEIQQLLEQQLTNKKYTPFKEDLKALIRLYFDRLKEIQ